MAVNTKYMNFLFCLVSSSIAAQDDQFFFKKCENDQEISYSVHQRTFPCKWLAGVTAKKNASGDYSNYELDMGTYFNYVSLSSKPNFDFKGRSKQEIFRLFEIWYKKQK